MEVCLSAKMDWNAEAHTCVNDFNSGPDKVHFERPGSRRIHGGGGWGRRGRANFDVSSLGRLI